MNKIQKSGAGPARVPESRYNDLKQMLEDRSPKFDDLTPLERQLALLRAEIQRMQIERNAYLSPQDRAAAPMIYRALKLGAELAARPRAKAEDVNRRMRRQAQVIHLCDTIR